jgi:HD-like signal output (HDOD) protein
VENPRSTARDLFDLIRCDPALTAKILMVVDSAFYGLPGQIASIDRAIVMLGLSAVENTTVAASMTQFFKGGPRREGCSGTDLWRHSLAVAVAARLHSAAQGRAVVEESFLTGLLHDIGLLIERQAYPDKFARVVSTQRALPDDFCSLEGSIIGADHAAFGMALAQKWRFPTTLRMAIGYHDRPMDLAPANQELAVLIQVADVLACSAGLGFSLTAANETLDDAMLAVLNLKAEQVDEVSARLVEATAQAEAVFSE